MNQKQNPVPYHNWTYEEVNQLNEGVRYYGTKFNHIQSAFLPHISAQIIKNKYYKLTKKGEITPNAYSQVPTQFNTGINTGINTPKESIDYDIDQMLADLNKVLGQMQ